MAYRPEIAPISVITSGNMAGNLTSKVTIIQKISMFSYAYSWSGSSPVGTISVQVSNDYALGPTGAVLNAGTWNTLTLNVGGSASTTISVSGNTGVGYVDLLQSGAYAVRTIYTAGSGTGTLQAVFCGKVS